MTDERKPTEDLKEGLGLLFRAAKGAVKQVDLAKIDKGLDKAFGQVGRAMGNVGKAVGDEIQRMATNPPWQKGDEPPAEEKKPEEDETEGEVHASKEEPKDGA
jgi:hypothetical protein